MNLLYKLFILTIIIVFSPLLIGISFLIVCTEGFPVFFLQKRIGKAGREFVLFKFRTMQRGSEELQMSLMKKNEAQGPVFKIYNDPRLTPIGRFLNHTGLDELPQLFNVLFGTMALIGPRPLPVSESARLKQWQHKREIILPGIISPWVIEGYHRTTFDAWMKSDIEYATQKTFTKDCVLCLLFLKYWFSLIATETVRTL